MKVEWDERPAACVVMASGGYPGSYAKGKVIQGLREASKVKDAVVFHSGTALKDGQVVTAGGRVLCVTGLGTTIQEAIHKAYEAVAHLSFDGAHYRKDIGWRAIGRK